MVSDATPPPAGARWREWTAQRLGQLGQLWRVVRSRGPAVLGVVGVAAVGAWIGMVLAPPTTAVVGPIETQVRVVPSLHPAVQVMLPPAGQVRFETHLTPVAVQARISQVDLESARKLINSPAGLRYLTDTAPDRLRSATVRAAITTAAFGLLGGVALALLAYRRDLRRTAEVAATVVGVFAVTAGLTALTFDADRLAQPRFTGLLSQAPYVANQAGSLVDRLQSYRSGLADIVRSVTALYATSGTLPVLPGQDSGDLITLLHLSDIHLNPLGFDLADRLVQQFHADAVIDTGDITTWGTPVESATLSRIGTLGVPYVFVRGNHDSLGTQEAVARQRDAIVLDDDVVTVAGVVIAGIGDPEFTPNPSEAALSRSSSTAVVPEPTEDGTAPPAGLAGGAPEGAAGAAAALTPSTPGPEHGGGGEDPTTRAPQRLADTIREWNSLHPQRPVQIATLHDPSRVRPLIGTVPLVLAGHTHHREVSRQGGTMVMVEGSTGGAGVTARGLARLSGGKPLPLVATLIYLARSGDRAGQIVGYDDVTVGGFGLASITLERHVVRPEDVPASAPIAPLDELSVPPSSTRRAN
jgi:predicted phosphodiesterase